MAAFRELADYVTINVSSPNTPGLRALQKRDALARLLAAVARRSAAPLPLFLKIAPDLAPEDEADVAALCLEHGIDALIVGNTTVARPVDAALAAKRAKPGASAAGRCSALDQAAGPNGRCASTVDVPLIGVGGIATGADAYAKIRAGATAVQLYTALVYEGPALVGRILRELDGCLARDGFDSLADAVGRDAPNLAHARVDPDRRAGLRIVVYVVDLSRPACGPRDGMRSIPVYR